MRVRRASNAAGAGYGRPVVLSWLIVSTLLVRMLQVMSDSLLGAVKLTLFLLLLTGAVLGRRLGDLTGASLGPPLVAGRTSEGISSSNIVVV